MSSPGSRPESLIQLSKQASSKPKISVLLADGNLFKSRGLSQYLERSTDFELVGKARSAKDVLWLLGEKLPEIVLLGMPMPNVKIGDLIAEIKEAHPECGVIVIGDRKEPSSIMSALSSGARGCLLRGSDPSLVRLAIASVSIGGIWIHPSVESLFKKLVLEGTFVSFGRPLPDPPAESGWSSGSQCTVELTPGESAHVVRKRKRKIRFRIWETVAVTMFFLVLALCFFPLLQSLKAEQQADSTGEPEEANVQPHDRWKTGSVFHLRQMR